VNERLLYRPTEAADLIAVSRARVYQLIAEGVIPSIRLGGSIRVPADALKAWVAQRVQDVAEAR
jgi:excisionase family DNA binding protein